MPELHFPWIAASIAAPLVGALWLCFVHQADQTRRCGILFCSITLALTCGGLVDYLMLASVEAHDLWLWGRVTAADTDFAINILVVDESSVFLLPLSALIFGVVFMSTLRTNAPRFPMKLALISESILLATFSCRGSWTLIALLAMGTMAPLIELKRYGRCVNIYAWHMSLFVGLLIVGYAWLGMTDVTTHAAVIPCVLLTAAALIRSGILPFHLWLADLYEKGSLGTAILFTTPLVGAYAVMRLVLPYASAELLHGIAMLSLMTAVYAAGIALVQREARRLFCYVLLSQSSLVLVGLGLVSPIGLTGALCLWLSVGLSLTGFGITLRSLEARISRVSLADFHGLYRQMPIFSGFFLLTGLASIGFPLTIGFIGMELLIEDAVHVFPQIGMLVVFVAALNGIAVLLAYFRIFTGRHNPTLIPMNVRLGERVAVLMLSVLILGGGLFPQPGVTSRYQAAQELTKLRARTRAIDDRAVAADHVDAADHADADHVLSSLDVETNSLEHLPTSHHHP